MVTTEVAQLSKECNAWRETLRSFKDEFGRFKNRLQDLAGRQTQRDVLLEVEHLDNQFHIQLINIHDLKQSIKIHQRQIDAGMAAKASFPKSRLVRFTGSPSLAGHSTTCR